jgi:serine/threonine protein kinase
VALKVLRTDFARDAKAMQRFIRGMKTARNLCHPHLVQLYNAGITAPYAWISMEFVEGASLAQIIQQSSGESKRDWKQALHVALDIGAALQFVHQQGTLHRNVMPQNILIQTRDGSAKLGDTMLAKALEGSASQEVTASGEYVGNIYYMAPERTVRGAEVDGRADLYSLGVTLYISLTGQMPFEGTSMPDVIAKIRQTVPPRPRKLQPAIPAAFDAVVVKLLSKRPDDRYPSAKEMLAELPRLAKV